MDSFASEEFWTSLDEPVGAELDCVSTTSACADSVVTGAVFSDWAFSASTFSASTFAESTEFGATLVTATAAAVLAGSGEGVVVSESFLPSSVSASF